jgi:glycosyltransferase involved in cell wall biosynthesis
VVAASYFHLAGLGDDDPRRVEILNGVDEDDLPTPLASSPPVGRFVLAHVGTLYDIQDPAPVLRALAELAERGEIDADLVEVRLVGSVWLPKFAAPPQIRVARVGYVDHARAVSEMCAATVLLLYVARSSLAPSGKLFEYLASGRPVLCVAHPHNLASRLVRDWNAGVAADPNDPAAIEQALLDLWNRWRESGLGDQAEIRERTLERYSRRATAARLAEVLEEASRG